MLTPKQVKFLREELKTAKNPLFFYDDDADGLCSFILLYKIHREGKGIIVKSTSKIDRQFLRKVNELNPDKIFVLDIPIVEQEFIDQAKRPVFWLDHHQPVERKNIHYFNPRLKDPDAYIPTTRLAYQINNDPENLWIAAVGCLGDWHMPDFIGAFIKQYPELLPARTDLPTAVYKRPVGKLVKLFFFLLRGPSPEVRNSIRILTKISSPNEIIEQETARGKFLVQRFEKINKKYVALLKEAKKQVSRSKILLFCYTEKQWSFTTNLANELAAFYPKKVILIARRKSGEMKCSIRGRVPISEPLERALAGISGHGGGHPQACGAVIKEEDWELFLQKFKKELGA